jgi:hypothetical protein
MVLDVILKRVETWEASKDGRWPQRRLLFCLTTDGQDLRLTASEDAYEQGLKVPPLSRVRLVLSIERVRADGSLVSLRADQLEAGDRKAAA